MDRTMINTGNWINRALLPVLLLCLAASGVRADTLERRVAVEEAMRRANDYFQASYSIGNEGWERSTYQTGNVRAWEILGVQAYYDRAVDWGEANGWEHGTDYGDWDGSSADAHCCGQTYFDLYTIDPDPVRTNVITQLLDDLLLNSQPDSYDDWWWIDAYYMAGSVLTRLAVLNSDTAYLNQLKDMYDYMKYIQGGGLFDDSLGLWWRDSGYKSSAPVTYWGRGNGWVIASLARNLEKLPANDTICRPEFEAMLQIMADALLPWQQPDGFWRSSITDPTNPSYDNPETSSTAFFTYAIAYGINEGILVDAPGTNYTSAVTNAWNGLVSIALHPDGKLGYTQAVGSDPQAADYWSERDYGTGAFLLAGGEILRLLGGVAPAYADAGPDMKFTDVDADYAEPVALSASNCVLRSGSFVDYSWWCGPAYLGSGSELSVDFPLGTNTVTLKAEHSDGYFYSGHLSVMVEPVGGMVISASGNESGNPPENTMDGDLNTRWSQDGNDGSQWIQYELPVSAVIDHIDIAFFLGDQREGRIAIWLSLDGVDFNRVLPTRARDDYVSSSGTTLELETFSFSSQEARYIRIVGWGNSSSSWNSITEVSIPVTVSPIASDQADHDANGLPDSWEIHYLGSTGQVASAEIGDTGITLGDAYVQGLDPVVPDASAMIHIGVASNQPALSLDTIGAFGVGYQGLTRKYSMLTKMALTNETWAAIPGLEDITGSGLPVEVSITNTVPAKFYTADAWLE